MKLWRIIWAMYVLVLSGLPCDAFCPGEPKAATEQVSQADSNDHAQDAGCSPFCLCAACPGFALPQPPRLMGVTALAVLPMAAPISLYCPAHPLDVPSRIWQPPRLG